MRHSLRLLAGLSLAGSATAAAPLRAQQPVAPDTLAPYRNPRLPTDARVHDLMRRMSLQDKFWQLFMIPGSRDDPADDYSHGVFGLQISEAPAGDSVPLADAAREQAERIDAIQRYFVDSTRLGIPIIPFDEAVHGLVRDGATVFPQAIALAATWDTTLMTDVATAIAQETRSRGIRQVLSPVVNIASDVRWGRVEETYGEDPYLTSVMARNFIEPFERAGVVTTPKHFVANVGAGGRDSYPIDWDARVLGEYFFPPFKAAVTQAHALSVMSAYNSVDGVPATQNRALLTDKLKRDWGFRGFVISDAAATGGATVLQHTEASTATATRDAFNAGLDVVFQSSYAQYRPYLAAFERGLVPRAVMDSSVARVLRVKFQLGLFDHPFVDPDSAAAINGSPSHVALARQAAREAIVLLKNDRDVLPLSDDVGSVAVLGADASEARLGGYSGPGVGACPSSTRFARAWVRRGYGYAPGPGRTSVDHIVVPGDRLSTIDGGRTVPGLLGEYWDNNRFDGAAEHHADRSRRGLRMDAELAGPRHTVRLVLGALDGVDHGAGRPASIGWASRATTATGSTSTARCSSTTGRSGRTGRAWPTSHLAPGQHARRAPRVLREHRQRAGEAGVGCRRCPTTGGRRSTAPWPLPAGATSPWSWPASRRANSATAPCSGFPGIRKRSSTPWPQPARPWSSCSSAAARSRCRDGSTTWMRCSTPGIRESRAGRPWPTCCSATPIPPAGCPSPSP